MIKTILFDLDGTLLPMDQEQFVELYFQKLAAKMAYAFDSRQLIRSIWAATEAMIKDQGPERNERVFWKKMEEMYGESILEYVPVFERFYEQEFQEIQKVYRQQGVDINDKHVEIIVRQMLRRSR